MQELARQFEPVLTEWELSMDATANTGPDVQAIQELAKRWASMSLETFQGDLLARALDISKAMADFTCELLMQPPCDD